MHITPQSNGEEKIIDVFFLDVEYKAQDKDNLKYLNSINLQIYTLNMLGKNVDFKIYDTINGEEKELYKSEASLKIEQKNGIVKTKQAITLTPFMPMKTQKDMTASEHHYKIKIWETGNETNFYEEELKVKNEMGSFFVAQDNQVAITTGTSKSPKKKEEEEKKDEKCFCDRDFTVDEIKKIVKELRDSNAYIKKKFGYDLFSKSDCKIPEDEKTYEKFTEELNLCFNKYEINKCIRKIHFLSQSYTESAFFTTTIEGGGLKYLQSKKYYPFIGRGLIQLTHSGEAIGEAGYKQYFDYLDKKDYKTKSDLLNTSLHYAIDASGYFWFRGKYLGKGDFLK